MSEIKQSDYDRSGLEKGFTSPTHTAEEILDNNLQKGLISESEFCLSFETLDIIKGGKRAQVGETREWKGTKYKKNLKGWEKVKKVGKKYTEDFVDEDTGEIETVERYEDTPEEKQAKSDASEAKRKGEKKLEKKSDKEYKSYDKTEKKYTQAMDDLKNANSQLKVLSRSLDNALNVQQDAEAGYVQGQGGEVKLGDKFTHKFKGEKSPKNLEVTRVIEQFGEVEYKTQGTMGTINGTLSLDEVKESIGGEFTDDHANRFYQDNIKPIENDINEAESAIKKIKNTIKQLTSSLDKKESKL